ncbi:hypothetical protein KSP40_PGU018354 [Platanthera guangdongensis]|uniref:Uncharacterized protein n=1 Tax=Platanthera guangdongensis TaxID=2320717 RepID=A0ABR2LM94_9ASPA
MMLFLCFVIEEGLNWWSCNCSGAHLSQCKPSFGCLETIFEPGVNILSGEEVAIKLVIPFSIVGIVVLFVRCFFKDSHGLNILCLPQESNDH